MEHAAPVMAARRPLRVLCLAGFRQSERGFREKTGALRKALRGRAELVCLSGPHPVSEAAEPDSGETHPASCSGNASRTSSPFRFPAPCTPLRPHPSFLLPQTLTDSSLVLPGLGVQGHGFTPCLLSPRVLPSAPALSLPSLPPPPFLPCRVLLALTPPPPRVPAGPCAPEEQPRGWWFSEAAADTFSALEEPAVCRGLQEALAAVARALSSLGPFDGILGFSQGAALAALVCALGQAGDPRFPLPRFIILVSGFCPRGLVLKEPILKSPLSLPSLHVFGETDRVIPAQESVQLASRFPGAVTLTHSGGHFIPAAAAQRQAYLKFLDQFAE